MKWLIVTADDFGIGRGVNRGIVQAHQEGILTSASLMVDRPATAEAIALAHDCPDLSLGLHLEFDLAEPERVPDALERQLGRFVRLVGALPTHADSHHDVHRDPYVLSHVLRWARRAGLYVRGLSRVHHLSKFYGQWGGQTHPEQIDVAGFLRLLDGEIRDGVTELTCHPGYVDSGFASSYAAERELELQTLCDPRSRQGISARGISLIGFRDVPPLAATTGTPLFLQAT